MQAKASAALAFACNEFQLNHWNALDPRLKCSLVVPYEDPEASRQEIRRHAGDRRFAHVLMLTRTAELMGRRRYWPIYEAACEAGLPVGVHVFGYSGRAASNTGWPSFYIEEMTEHSNACQAQVTSMIMEGVFEAFPQLRMVFIEMSEAMERITNRLTPIGGVMSPISVATTTMMPNHTGS